MPLAIAHYSMYWFYVRVCYCVICVIVWWSHRLVPGSRAQQARASSGRAPGPAWLSACWAATPPRPPGSCRGLSPWGWASPPDLGRPHRSWCVRRRRTRGWGWAASWGRDRGRCSPAWPPAPRNCLASFWRDPGWPGYISMGTREIIWCLDKNLFSLGRTSSRINETSG